MSDARKETLFRWLPVFTCLLGMLGQAAWLGNKWGVMETRMLAFEAHARDQISHMPLQEKLAIFLPRAEFAQIKTARDAELLALREDFRAGLSAVNAKLDRLIERSAVSKND